MLLILFIAVVLILISASQPPNEKNQNQGPNRRELLIIFGIIGAIIALGKGLAWWWFHP